MKFTTVKLELAHSTHKNSNIITKHMLEFLRARAILTQNFVENNSWIAWKPSLAKLHNILQLLFIFYQIIATFCEISSTNYAQICPVEHLRPEITHIMYRID